MAVAEAPAVVVPAPVEHPEAVGPIGRLGGWAADHIRIVALSWAVLAIALAVFAPKVETALSGAGWQANGSDSVQARTLIQKNFGGLASSAPIVVIHSPDADDELARLPRDGRQGGGDPPFGLAHLDRRSTAAGRLDLTRRPHGARRRRREEATRRRWSPPPRR